MGPGPWPVEGPVLKPQHLECKMQFHSAAAPSGPACSEQGGTGESQSNPRWGSFPWPGAEQQRRAGLWAAPWLCWQCCRVLLCCRQGSQPWLWQPRLSPGGSHSTWAQGEVLLGEGWVCGRTGTGGSIAPSSQCCSLGNTKLFILSTIIAKSSLLVSWCRRQEQSHSWEL